MGTSLDLIKRPILGQAQSRLFSFRTHLSGGSLPVKIKNHGRTHKRPAASRGREPKPVAGVNWIIGNSINPFSARQRYGPVPPATT